MTIHLHRASRTDQLAEGLGELLATPLEDPFAHDVVVVPTHGVERWLSQRLADRLGVCAGITFLTPWSLFSMLRGGEDPWSPDAILWPLLDTIDDSLDEDWAAPLARHLGDGWEGEERELRRGRRFAAARRLSRLFGAYATQRPSVIADWAAGRDTDGRGEPLATDLAWQPQLWRALLARIDAPAPHVRHAEMVERLTADPGAAELPPRMSLFGHTRLPVVDVDLIRALGAHRDVHLWLPHPSAAMWGSLADVTGVQTRRGDTTYELLGHPLLRSLGRDIRELQRSLSTLEAETNVIADPPPAPGLLGRLQADLRADRVTGGHRLAPEDRSVQIHACHGPARQVEVLREVLLGLLADDPTLEPRDIVVMCPDIEAYAPLITSVFGLEGSHPAGRLRLSLADRAADQVNPLLEVLQRVVALADGRAAADVIIDLASAAAVRRRFGWDDDGLETVITWVEEAGIRWGFDAAHRAEYGLIDVLNNSWEFGLDRLALGAAMSADSGRWIDKTLPLDEIGSSDIETAGRFAEFIARVRAAVAAIRSAGTAAEWREALQASVDSLADPTEPWQSGHLQRSLRERLPDASTRMRLADVRVLLADAFEGRATRSSFRTGAVTVCTMMPMRSVPHRVVCLLGVDDGVFPRVVVADGDDVLAREPLTGERDVRSEDRQLLLDAVLAATQHLVITYTGADVLTGQTRPPAVPLGELMDALNATAEVVGGSVADAVTTRHPLQPFDARNFVAPSPFSFDAVGLEAARASISDRTPWIRPIDQPLPVEAGDVHLHELVDFFASPVKAYFRQRLQVVLPREETPLAVSLPVEVRQLDEWAVGDRVLRELLQRRSLDDVKAREWRRGSMPPGRLGWRRLGEIVDNALPVAREAVAHREREPRAVDVDIDLGGGRRLRGTVPDVYGDRILAASYSRLAAKPRLQSWVRLLALSVDNPDRAWSAVTIGRPARGAGFEVSHLPPLDHTAQIHLRDLVALFDAGRRQPIPLPVKSSYEYANQRRAHQSVDDAMRRVKSAWEGDDNGRDGERDEPAAVAAWGPFADLRSFGRPLPGEEYDGETTRFGALAMRVWMPLFAAERGR